MKNLLCFENCIHSYENFLKKNGKENIGSKNKKYLTQYYLLSLRLIRRKFALAHVSVCKTGISLMIL